MGNMRGTKFGQTFFESTRGRILDLIRSGMTTVDELSRKLELTDNAVRAHLATLERDRLVEQSGTQRGNRRPHFSYRLTTEAEVLFPKAYQVLLSRLLHVLKQRLEPDVLDDVLREVGRMLVPDLELGLDANSIDRKAETALTVMDKLGGAARIEETGDNILIRSNGGCPFSDVVSDHPEICRLAETLLSEITRTEVRERCDRGGMPRCTFEILASQT